MPVSLAPVWLVIAIFPSSIYVHTYLPTTSTHISLPIHLSTYAPPKRPRISHIPSHPLSLPPGRLFLPTGPRPTVLFLAWRRR